MALSLGYTSATGCTQWAFLSPPLTLMVLIDVGYLTGREFSWCPEQDPSRVGVKASCLSVSGSHCVTFATQTMPGGYRDRLCRVGGELDSFWPLFADRLVGEQSRVAYPQPWRGSPSFLEISSLFGSLGCVHANCAAGRVERCEKVEVRQICCTRQNKH